MTNIKIDSRYDKSSPKTSQSHNSRGNNLSSVYRRRLPAFAALGLLTVTLAAGQLGGDSKADSPKVPEPSLLEQVEANPNAFYKYTVEPGDTLGQIAEQMKAEHELGSLSVDFLRDQALAKDDNPTIHPGDTFYVPIPEDRLTQQP
jgi:hypothetical protein